MREDTVAVTVLEGGAVITIDGDRRVLDPGAVAIRGDRVIAAGERDEVRGRFPDAATIRLDHHVMLPGLVDSHGHAGHGLIKGIADGADFRWPRMIGEIYATATDEEFWRAESYLSALERLEYGVTTSLSMTGSAPRVDDPRYAVAAAAGYAALGLRHIVALGPPDPPWPQRYRDLDSGDERLVDLDRAFQTVEDTISRLHDAQDGRIAVYVAPSGLVPETRDGRATEFAVRQMRMAVEMAQAHDTGLHAHARAGQIAAAAQAAPDILSPRLSLAHCAGISLDEARMMAETGVSASHGPLTHAYAAARFPLIEALDAGVNVAISTDGSAPDRSFDLLSQGRIAVQLQRAHFADTSLLPAGKTLEMMTIDAARALGMDWEIGSIEPGKKADIIAIDLRSARLAPRFMLPQRVVYAASGLDVSFVMVDGRVLMRDRSLAGVDVDSILDDAQRAAEEAIQRAGAGQFLAQHPDMWGSVRYRRD
jgi:cytosine/adenosine deaminase-related metal-dependent hydrolase